MRNLQLMDIFMPNPNITILYDKSIVQKLFNLKSYFSLFNPLPPEFFFSLFFGT